MEIPAKYTTHHIPDIQMDDSPEVRNKIICNPTNWKKEVANDSEISKISRQNFFWAFVSLFQENLYPKMLFQSSHLSWISGVVDILGSKLDIYQKTCSESGFWGCQSKPEPGGEGSPYAAKFVQKDNNISLITRVKKSELFSSSQTLRLQVL